VPSVQAAVAGTDQDGNHDHRVDRQDDDDHRDDRDRDELHDAETTTITTTLTAKATSCHVGRQDDDDQPRIAEANPAPGTGPPGGAGPTSGTRSRSGFEFGDPGLSSSSRRWASRPGGTF
jgi:hypothetical protein